MIDTFLQRGLAAGIISAAFIIGTGPAALAQGQRSTPAAKPAPARKRAAKPAGSSGHGTTRNEK